MTEQNTQTNHTIRVEIKDWLFNAGLVGLYRILKHAGIPVTRQDNYIQFDAQAFDGFEHHFFKYFYDTYEKDSYWYELISFYDRHMAQLDGDNLSEEDEERIAEFEKRFCAKPTWYSSESAYRIINGQADYVTNILKAIKSKKITLADKLELIQKAYHSLKENKHIIQSKFVSYWVIFHYWRSICFLNPQKVSVNMFELYKKDFLDSILPFLNAAPKEKPACNCFACNRPINTRNAGYTGLTWLNMDLDPNRKTNLYWNYKTDIVTCPICHLVYSCVPAGFVTVRRKGIFINDNSNIDSLLNLNYVTKDRMEEIKKIEEAENLSYVHIINLIRQARDKNLPRELSNIQIIKNEGDRKYTFNMLSKHLLKVIEASEKELEYLRI